MDFSIVSSRMLNSIPHNAVLTSDINAMYSPSVSACLNHLKMQSDQRSLHQRISLSALFGLNGSFPSSITFDDIIYSEAAWTDPLTSHNPCALGRMGPQAVSSTEQLILFDSLGRIDEGCWLCYKQTRLIVNST